MININLIKNHLPTEIDIPKKHKKSKILVIVIAVVIVMAVSVGIIYKTLLITHSNYVTQKNISKKIKKTLKEVREKPPKTATKHVKKMQNKPSKNNSIVIKNQHLSNKPLHVKNNKKANFYENNNKIEIHKSESIFTISFKFVNIPKQKNKKVASKERLTPLPKQLLPPTPINKKQTRKNIKLSNVIYEIKVKTTRIKMLKNILKKFNTRKISEKVQIIGTTTLFNVYVGGLYDYSKTLKFSNMLTKKGYKVYQIKNIGLAYYILIDKRINKIKKEAYIQAWAKTPFKIYFEPIKEKKVMYTLIISTPNKKLIKILKKYRFYPIIKVVKNGA